MDLKKKKINSLLEAELSCPHCHDKVVFKEDENKTICPTCHQEVEFEVAMEEYRNSTSSSVESIMANATELIEKGNFKEASNILEDALKEYPYSGRLHFALLLSHFELSSPSEIKRVPDDILKDDLNFKCAYRYLNKEDRNDLLSLINEPSEVKDKKEKTINPLYKKISYITLPITLLLLGIGFIIAFVLSKSSVFLIFGIIISLLALGLGTFLLLFNKKIKLPSHITLLGAMNVLSITALTFSILTPTLAKKSNKEEIPEIEGSLDVLFIDYPTYHKSGLFRFKIEDSEE